MINEFVQSLNLDTRKHTEVDFEENREIRTTRRKDATVTRYQRKRPRFEAREQRSMVLRFVVLDPYSTLSIQTARQNEQNWHESRATRETGPLCSRRGKVAN